MSLSEKIEDLAALRVRFDDVYRQSLHFMEIRRGKDYSCALATAMMTAAIKYLAEVDVMRLSAVVHYGVETVKEKNNKPA